MLQKRTWNLVERDGIQRLERAFEFRDSAGAQAFADEVGRLAGAQGHRPVVELTLDEARVTWRTHKTKGLHVTDFLLAAKIDKLHSPGQAVSAEAWRDRQAGCDDRP